jgi:hypothetical protein
MIGCRLCRCVAVACLSWAVGSCNWYYGQPTIHASVWRGDLQLLLPALAESSLGMLVVRAGFASSAWEDMVSFGLVPQQW